MAWKPKYEQGVEIAQKKFKHYFRQVYEKVGLNWDRDNDSEIDEAVAEIYRSAVSEAVDIVNQAFATRKAGDGR